MSRLYDGGLIDGPSAIFANGGTVEDPIQPALYGRQFDGGTIADPAVSTPDEKSDLLTIVSHESFICRHNGILQEIPAGPLGFRVPQFEDIRYQNGSFAKAICEHIWLNKTSQRSTFVNSLPSGTAEPANYNRRHDHSAPRIDLSCISPWNSQGGRTRTGTLINPTHTIHAWHSSYTPLVGTLIKFVSMRNDVYEREVIARQRIGTSDIGVCRLNSPLPPDIKPAIIPPQNFYEYIKHTIDLPGWSTTSDPRGLAPIYPVYRIDRLRGIGIRLFQGSPSTSLNTTDIRVVWMTEPFWGDIIPIDTRPEGGDSGLPCFWPFKGRALVLLLMFEGIGDPVFWEVWRGSSPSNFIAQIESFAGLIEIADLSEFENYYA